MCWLYTAAWFVWSTGIRAVQWRNYTVTYLVTTAREVVLVSVCRFVCLFVNRIRRKQLNRLP